jgi:Zn-dependent hydrolases, including glyoxylases
MGGFKIQGNVRIGDVEVIALKSLGGHQAGQLFYYFPQQRLLFTGDSLINMNSLNDEKREYMSLAKVLMTSVNVDPALAREERAMLEKLIREMSEKGDVNVCPGHGDIITDSDRRCDV